MPSETRNDDRALIALVNDQFLQLGASGGRVDSVMWMGPSGFRPSSVRDGLPSIAGNTLLLPEPLREKLGVDEWKPLLISSIVLDCLMNVGRRIKVLLVGWLLLLVLILIIPMIVGVPDGPIPVLSVMSVFFFTVYYGIYSIPRARIGARLKADRVAARATGKEGFIVALEKVESLDLNARPEYKGDYYEPTIGQRVRNIRRQ